MSSRELTYIEAIKEAFDLTLELDSNVVLIGEGVPDPKAIFTSTIGLQEKYGKQRIFDMPLSENGMTGICIGAALTGLRPVLIHQRIDFSLLAVDQIINNAAKWHYMFNGQANVPVVVRMIVGRGWGQGPQHSQSLQTLYAANPGLKVVMPSTAYDAKGMMIAAIEDNNPVIFIEHRWLHQTKSNVPVGHYRVNLNKANILREGSKITIASFSYMTIEALQAAEALEAFFEVDVEIVDMRTVAPLDVELVLDSVKKTGFLMALDTAHKTGSYSAELISQIVEKGFAFLKAAPVRIASPDFPAPTSPFMSKDYYPSAITIADAVLDLLSIDYQESDNYNSMKNALLKKLPDDVPNANFNGPF